MPTSPAIDLVVTDLDGTLWDHQTSIHPSTVDALATLAGLGVPVIAATGRRKISALTGFAKNGLTLPAIVINGAYGFVPAAASLNGSAGTSETEFHRHPFDVDAALAVLDIYAAHGHVPLAYNVDGTTHVSDHATTSDAHRSTFGADAVRSEPVHAARAGTVLGFSIIGLAASTGLQTLGEELAHYGVNVDHYRDPLYGGYSVMAQAPGVSKWLGVTRYREYAGLTDATVLALGDGGNDIELLEGADIAISVEGGDERALEAADHVIAPPQHGGWATVLDFF